MKKISLKSIIAMMVAFVCMSANAQRVVKDIDSKNVNACWQYLVNNKKDTIETVILFQNGEIRRTVYITEGILTAWQDTTLYNKVEISNVSQEKLDTLRRNSLQSTANEQAFKGKARDNIWTETLLPNGEVMITSLRGADQDGFGVNLYAGYQLAEHINDFSFGAGVEYTRPWWGIYLNAELGKSFYTSNAVKEGDYLCFRAESALMVQPIKLDKNNQNRLFIFGGMGFETYETDSKEISNPDGTTTLFRSWGNYMYPTAGVKIEHRIPTTGNSWYLAVQWRGLEGVLQNSNPERYSAVMFTVGFEKGIFRNKVHNMTRRAIKKLLK
jgi:hypothetical protein